MLSKLPLELQQEISNHLPQSDCYHLIQTSKQNYKIHKPRLYRSIIITTKRQYYHKELRSFDDVRTTESQGQFKSSLIRTGYGLKAFFRSLMKGNDISIGKGSEVQNENSHFVEYLEVGDELPGIEIDAAMMLSSMACCLNNLKGLKMNYSSCFFKVEDSFLSKLPRLSKLKSLDCESLKLKLSQEGFLVNDSLKELKLSRSGRGNVSHGLNLGVLSKLSVLELNGAKSIEYPLTYMKQEISYNLKNDDTDIEFKVMDYFQEILTPESSSLELKSLKLSGFSIDSKEVDKLIQHINFNRLKKLELIEMKEAITEPIPQHDTQLQHIHDSLLSRLQSHVPNLSYLALDLNNNYKDYVPNFLLAINDLKVVYLNLRWNKIKERSSQDVSPEKVFANYMHSLVKHSNLQCLLIDCVNETKFELIDLNCDVILSNLGHFSQLKTLKLNLKVVDLIRFVQFVKIKLGKLKFLELCLTEFNCRKTLIEQHVINFQIIKKKSQQNSSVTGTKSGIESSVTTIMPAPQGCTIVSDDDYRQDSELCMSDLELRSLNLFKILKSFQINTNIEYLKIFNMIVELKDLEIRGKGLEYWFNEQLKGYGCTF
ncbi:unnamed protein product [Ambrosiozyma monospora]|uniref:Unnamed protein product n=1 Tax=Ambrosiozyma monospora TaxID=43982 RepID=A0A9W6YL85_AMBMO|nr:unnamed protein product [Ambrosiozyma monospora]